MNDYLIAYGQKVRLESMKLQDIESMMSWGRHEDLLFEDYNFPYLSEEEQECWYEFKTRGAKRCFSVFNQEGEMVGYIALRNVNRILRRSEMGIVFNPSRLNKGYGTDAIKTLLRWYFEDLHYRKLILNVAAYNKRAIRAYEKAGFRKVSEAYGVFMNKAMNPLQDIEYQSIRCYFRKHWGETQVLQYKMEISTLSTA